MRIYRFKWGKEGENSHMPFRWTTGCVCLLQLEILDGPEENERPGGLVYYGTQERGISNYAPAASMRSSLRSL